jgi:FkbM family methyltransferase
MKPFVKAYNKYGTKLLLSPLEFIDSFVLSSGYYESEVLEAILPFLVPGAVFWDIGSNFGLHAITAKYLKPEARVICIEPSPLMIARLQANARLNNVNVEIISAALTDSRGFRHLHLAEGNSGMTTLKPLETASYPDKVLCWCDTGDNLVKGYLPTPTVIKLDVEGSEIDVLRGLKNVLTGTILKAIILEADPTLITKLDSELYRILTSAGFKIKVLTRNEKTQHHLENFIAVRS